MEEASRSLAHASLGASYEEVETLRAIGADAWLDEQMSLPVSSHLETMQALVDRYADPNDDQTLRSPVFRRFAWWREVMTSRDGLRHRVALALSEIFVISALQDFLFIHPEAVASFYDLLG